MSAVPIRCPRCLTPHDGQTDAAGQATCVVCNHRWLVPPSVPAPAVKTDGPQVLPVRSRSGRLAPVKPVQPAVVLPELPQSGPRPDQSPAMQGKVRDEGRSNEYLPDEDVRKPNPLTVKLDADDPVLPIPIVVNPALAPPQPVVAAVPEQPIQSDLFERAEKSAQAGRASLRTQPELPPPQVPVPASAAGCPVCGHAAAPAEAGRKQTCSECGAVFDPGSGAIGHGSSSSSAAVPKDPFIGATMNGCLIDRKIGEGGMGSVYHAKQLSLDRSVAIKVLPADLARNGNFISRFEREAKSLARINHPNILHIYDFGEDPQHGVYFMIMEFVDGRDLGAILHERLTLNQLEALDFLRQATLGIEQAAEKGVIHRDIKPDNLMVTRSGTIKVSDFGLAKGYADDKDVTSVGVRVGTPAFMSPEQCDGLDVDWHSDIYNLGCTAYLALTGRLPFDGDTPFAIMLKHKSDPVPGMREIEPRIDAKVERLICRLLAKRPEDRYRSLRALVEEIELLMADLRGSSAVLRKTNGPMRALVQNPDGSVRETEPAPLPPRASASSGPVSGRLGVPSPTGGAPEAIPDWLRPVDVPVRPPPAPSPPPQPAYPQPLPPVRTSGSGVQRGPVQPARHESSHEDLRASRVGRKFDVELELARSRGRNAEVDALIASAERLAAAGRWTDAARDWQRASELSVDPQRASRLTQQAKSARLKAGRNHVLGRILWTLAALLLVAAGLFFAPPYIHDYFLGARLESAMLVRDLQQRARELDGIIRDSRPWPWYETIFQRGYDLPSVVEARRQLDRSQELLRKDSSKLPGSAPIAASLTELERQYKDAAVPWADVVKGADAMLQGRLDAQAQKRVAEIRSRAAAEAEAIEASFIAMAQARSHGRHGEALDAAARLRTLRIGPAAMGRLLLPARVEIVDIDRDGKPVLDAQVRVDGVVVVSSPGPVPGSVRIARSPRSQTNVEIGAPGMAVAKAVFPASTDAAESVQSVALPIAPIWSASGTRGWAALHALAGDLVAIHRTDGVIVRALADGREAARLGEPLQPFWREHEGGVQLVVEGGEAHDIYEVRRHSLPNLVQGGFTYRSRFPVLAMHEHDCTYRAGVRLRLIVEGVPGEVRLRVFEGETQRWQYAGLASSHPPILFSHEDRVGVIDDNRLVLLDEDGHKPAAVVFSTKRTGPAWRLDSAGGWLVPTLSGVELVRLGARSGQATQLRDAVLAGAGPAHIAVSRDLAVLARSDRRIECTVWRDGAFEPRWQAEVPLPPVLAPGLSADHVAIADDTGRVTVLSLANGALVRRIAHGSRLAAVPLVLADRIVVTDMAGGVAAYPLRH